MVVTILLHTRGWPGLAGLLVMAASDSDGESLASVDDFDLELMETGIPLAFDKFNCFKDLQSKITEYEKRNFVQVWKREARTIAAAQKHTVKYMKPEFVIGLFAIEPSQLVAGSEVE